VKLTRRWKIFIGAFGLLLLTLIVSMCYFWFTVFGWAQDDVTLAPAKTPQNHIQETKPIFDTAPKVTVPEVVYEEDVLKSPKGRIFILALGVDARGDKLIGRSDAMVVMSLDKGTNQLHMVSIPRDSYVKIAGQSKYDKITHAYAYGGVKMAQQTVEELLGIKIDHYVVFNFSSFLSLINSLDGIEIDVPFSFSEQDSNDKQGAVHVKKGLQVLRGEEALAYARMRHQDPKGDIGRGERQQEVVKSVLNELISFSSLSKLTSIRNSIKGSMATDVNLVDFPSLFPYLTSFSTIEMHSMTGSSETINGVYYYKLSDSSVNEVREIFK
jgi:LCP family protein required for cell wall assembly